MIEIENTDVYGWRAAIRGMRNSYNSWNKIDSGYCCNYGKDMGFTDCNDCPIDCDIRGNFMLGENDLKLMRTLVKAGNDHAKFTRMINVACDITAPFYWWKEFDTYKVGTVANSCSTIHKIHAKEFTLDDFSHEHLKAWKSENGGDFHSGMIGSLKRTIEDLNYSRERYLETKDKNWWWQLIQLLPTSYNQKRTVQLNYQVLKNMYHARKSHKLTEWIDFCKWIETLPYFKEIYLN